VQTFYGDSVEKDSVILERAESGEVPITLCTYSKGTEGTNVKAWGVAFLVSSVNNEKNVEQAVGRIRRTKPGKPSPAIVYDFRVPNVYALSSHGHTRDHRYKQLGFQNEQEMNRPPMGKRTIFSRGYN
jgi:superfamily II DNA or RNA helicase